MEKETHFSGLQDQGDREEQQDSYAFGLIGQDDESLPMLAALADGMGGEKNGRLCSEHLVTSFIEHLGLVPDTDIPEKLWQTLQECNETLAHAKGGAEQDGGTTFVGAWFDAENLYWISVGDSLLYHYREGNMQRLNADHSLQPELLRRAEAGEMTHEQALQHKDRHLLCSAICGDPMEMIDCPEHPKSLQPDDILVLASDGILSLPEEQIQQTLDKFRDNSAASITNKLMEQVCDLKKNAQDNITLQVIKIPSAPA